MAPEAKEETITIGITEWTKSEVKSMDDGEFDHIVAYASQQGTELGDEQVETLQSWRGKKKAKEEDTESATPTE